MADSNNIIRPLPQRVWQIAPASSDPPSPASPAEEAQEAEKESNNISPSRTRSILNLTSSTLFGIYSPSSPDGGYSQGNTPWATGSMTPQTPAYSSQAFFEDQSSPTIGAFERPQLRPTPHRPRHKPLFSGKVVPLALRSTLLFLSGVVYGVMVTYLHENETLTPVKLEGVHRHTWQYLLFWGSASVIMGNMLPWLDVLFEETSSTDKAVNGPRPRTNKMNAENRRQANAESGTGANVSADWFPAVRGIGVFIGIAYAIRRLPWESTLQATLTLVLVNPVLWYIVDRSRVGFIVPVFAAFAGTLLFTAINPKILPASDPVQPSSLITSEMIGVSTWVASVIFCSCVCFSSIGKRLAFWSDGL